MAKFHVLCVVWLQLTVVSARIQLVGHGYQKVAVVISPDVDVDPLLLTTLEDILTQGSASLFAATKNQLYFEEFIIVLPNKWPTQANYESVLDSQIDRADITIEPPNARSGDNPYVRNPNPCGEEGEYMHLTPNYILDASLRERFGPAGRLIVHEWAHLRWGVEDEYADNAASAFYAVNGQWLPTRCTEEVEGDIVDIFSGNPCVVDSSTGRPTGNCFFDVDETSPAVASLMFMQHLQHVVEFCDDADTAPTSLKHNKLAPNRQNARCNYRSIWEVMRQHSDFAGLSFTPALPDTTDTRPQFRYVQPQSRNRVLVLDVSGSMSGIRLLQLRQAAISFILGSVETGSFLGIVQFSHIASMLSPVVRIDSDETRDGLVNTLPNDADGGTSIGAGLLLGIEVLENNASTVGGSLILITDGEETYTPTISDVIPVLITKGVTVHTIAISQSADLQLANLAQVTGGQSFFVSGSLNSTAFIDGLTATVATDNNLLPNENFSISILTEAGFVADGVPFDGTFFIDSTIGRGTTLIVTSTDHVDIQINSPNGPFEVSNVTELSESGSTVIKILLGDITTTGLWSYQVTTNASGSTVTVNVQSQPQNGGQEILQIRSWISRAQNETVVFSQTTTLGIYAEVTRGKTPVINSNVTATVETPGGRTFDLQLFDTGVGIDSEAEDGVYSTILIAPDFDGDGRYSVKVKALGLRSQTRVFVAGQGGAKRAFDPRIRGFVSSNDQTQPLEDFQRVASAGEFRITGYVLLTTDGLPPARITDFRMAQFNSDQRSATLEWTAVGDDMDRGRASRYVIYVSHNESVIISNTPAAALVLSSQVLNGNLSSPSAAGNREQVVIQVQQLGSNADDTVYMRIVAVDEANNEGDPSNLVAISDAKEIWRRSDGTRGCNSSALLIIAFILLRLLLIAG